MKSDQATADDIKRSSIRFSTLNLSAAERAWVESIIATNQHEARVLQIYRNDRGRMSVELLYSQDVQQPVTTYKIRVEQVPTAVATARRDVRGGMAADLVAATRRFRSSR